MTDQLNFFEDSESCKSNIHHKRKKNVENILVQLQGIQRNIANKPYLKHSVSSIQKLRFQFFIVPLGGEEVYSEKIVRNRFYLSKVVQIIFISNFASAEIAGMVELYVAVYCHPIYHFEK